MDSRWKQRAWCKKANKQGRSGMDEVKQNSKVDSIPFCAGGHGGLRVGLGESLFWLSFTSFLACLRCAGRLLSPPSPLFPPPAPPRESAPSPLSYISLLLLWLFPSHPTIPAYNMTCFTSRPPSCVIPSRALCL